MTMPKSREKQYIPKPKLRDTKQLERELLHILLTDKMTLRKVVTTLRQDWMTDDKRLFIFDSIIKAFRGSNTLLSKEILFYDIEKLYEMGDKTKIEPFKAEVEVVFKLSPVENANFFIDRLNKEIQIDKAHNVIEDTFLHLEGGDIDQAVGRIRSGAFSLVDTKKDSSLVSLDVESEDWIKEVKDRKQFPEKYTGIPTGFKKFDNMTGGLFKAELTIVFGLSGKGKSTVLKFMCNNMRNKGFNVLHVTNEENSFQVQTKYWALETEIEYDKYKRGSVSDEEITQWEKRNAERKTKTGGIWVLEIPARTDVTLIERTFYELEQKGVRIDVICLDYMDNMAPTTQAFSENDEQAKVSVDCKQVAIDCNVPLLSATQAGTNTEKQETKPRPFLSAQDVYGTKRKSHAANTLVGIVNMTASVGVTERKPEDADKHTVSFSICKNRDGPLFTFRQILLAKIGKFVDDESENKQADAVAQGIVDAASGKIPKEKSATVHTEAQATTQMDMENERLESEISDLSQSIDRKPDDGVKNKSFAGQKTNIEAAIAAMNKNKGEDEMKKNLRKIFPEGEKS